MIESYKSYAKQKLTLNQNQNKPKVNQIKSVKNTKIQNPYYVNFYQKQQDNNVNLRPNSANSSNKKNQIDINNDYIKKKIQLQQQLFQTLKTTKNKQTNFFNQIPFKQDTETTKAQFSKAKPSSSFFKSEKKQDTEFKNRDLQKVNDDKDNNQFQRLQDKLSALEQKIQVIKTKIYQSSEQPQIKKKSLHQNENQKISNSSIIESKQDQDYKLKSSQLINSIQYQIKQLDQCQPLRLNNQRLLHNNNQKDKNQFQNYVHQSNDYKHEYNNFIVQETKSDKDEIFYISKAIQSFQSNDSNLKPNKDHFIQIIQSIHFIKLIKQPTLEKLKDRKLYLPQKEQYKGKKTLILDLDETLIHCNESHLKPNDIKLKINFPNGDDVQIGINIRPYAKQILKNLSKYFEIIIFTASHSSYANSVINELDPENLYVQHRLFRQNCIQTEEGLYIKDLRVINRQLENMILVDNAAYSFAFQIDNGIPILSYYDNKFDQELLKLQNFLMKLLDVKDVRTIIQNTFKFNQFHNYYDPQDLIKNLYHI